MIKFLKNLFSDPKKRKDNESTIERFNRWKLYNVSEEFIHELILLRSDFNPKSISTEYLKTKTIKKDPHIAHSNINNEVMMQFIIKPLIKIIKKEISNGGDYDHIKILLNEVITDIQNYFLSNFSAVTHIINQTIKNNISEIESKK